jgi:hypothetical protein
MMKIQLSKKVIAMACMLALALAVVVISGFPARTQGTPQEQFQALTKHVLIASYYNANATSIFASCSGSGCFSGPTPVYLESIPCPGATGVKCTYEVAMAAETTVDPGNAGFYQFLIDGAGPNGGGTEAGGYYPWENQGAGGTYSSAYTVTSQVQNTSSNQSHSIAVNVACEDTSFSGSCSGGVIFTSLTIRVLKP